METRSLPVRLLVCLICLWAVALSAGTQPNIIIVLADDMGYGDLASYGSPNIRTPEIDQMAAEGVRFTDFYAAPVCAPSRVQIMTGCYHARTGLSFNPFPHSKRGLNKEEHTIAEYLKKAGYITKIVGKWHLGDAPDMLPHHHGFDEFFGYPYSNDMWPNNPRSRPSPHADTELLEQITQRERYTGYHSVHYKDDPEAKRSMFPPLPLFLNKQVIEKDPDQSTMTRRFTESAVEFIHRNKDRPFFLYLAHPMPHVPLFAGKDFKGKSLRGLYGDTIEEIDWSVGQLRKALEAEGIASQTMLVFTSDNGPWLQYGIDGGSAGRLRDGKGTTYEGGVRVPAVFWMPGTFKDGLTTSALSGNFDLLATVAGMVGFDLDPERIIDSRSLLPILSGESDEPPRRYFHYFASGRRSGYPNYCGIRDEKWKLRIETQQDGSLVPLELFDLAEDPSERFDRATNHPDKVERLLRIARAYNREFRKQLRPVGVTEHQWED
ncbi:MAG: sulfatase [Puniceicoccaceae bacterium]